MKTSFVYILKYSYRAYYTDVTSDIKKAYRTSVRKVCWLLCLQTKTCCLVFYTLFINIALAIQTKKQIKKWSNAKKQALLVVVCNLATLPRFGIFD